jgi:Mg-chelatase subunit ChlD
MSEEFSNLSPKEREARLTAFILGELSSAEADELRQQLAQDTELTREHARLQQTVELVRETSAIERKVSTTGTALRLDEQRREKLLATFKTPAPQAVTEPAVAPRRPKNFWYVPLSLAAVLVGLLALVAALPLFVKSRSTQSEGTSLRNLSPVGSFSSLFNRSSEKSAARFANLATEEVSKRESEVALTENFSTYVYDTEAAKAAPAPKVPAIALALPVIADADGDAGELKRLAGGFDGGGRAIQPMTEPPARNDVNRGLARGNEVASGNNRSFFDDSAYRAPAPTTPVSESDNRWDNNDLAGGRAIATAPQTPAANFGTLWAETGVGQRAVVNEWQSSPAAPSSGGSVLLGNAAYANTAGAEQFTLIPSAPGVPPPPPGEPTLTPQQAQSIIEARRLQLENSPVPARPSVLPPTALGDRLLGARDEKELAERLGAAHYAELAKEREVAGKPVSDFGSVSVQPTSPNVSSGGGVGSLVGGAGGGRGGGRNRAGLVGGGEANGGAIYAGVSVQPGLRPSLDGRNITDLTAVDQKVDGLKDAPLAQAAEPLSTRARLANDQSGVRALGVEFESKSKPAEDRFGRADDFAVTPEMIDAVKLQIQNAQSYAGVAGVAPAKDNLSANRSSHATTPSASAPNVAISGLSRIVPAQTPAPPASGPASGVTTYDFVSGDASGYAVNGALSTNAIANYFADVPATVGDNTLAWKFNADNAPFNNEWFVNDSAGKGLGSLGRTGTGIGSRLESRVEKIDGFKSDANGRIEIQLPAVANGGLEFRSKLLADPSAVDKLEALADLPQSRELEITRGQSAGSTAAGRYYFNLQSTNASVSAGGSVVFNPHLGTNAVLAKSEKPTATDEPVLAKKVSASAPTPQPEVLTRDNAFSTFSLNVSDVSFKLAAASLEKGAMPDVATVRSEEFINAFDYRDPVPLPGVPLAFVSERARYPFAHNRDVLRFSVRTAAQGRDGGKPLNIVLLLDNSGSMERADRVRIIQEALLALAAQLKPQDKLSVVTFSRTARLWADGVTGAQAAEVAGKIAALTPEGGTNVEEALDLAYRTALRHYAATAINRVVLLTDGAANLGNVEPAALKTKVESFRKQGVALDCFGIGWEGFNDDLLEQLSRNGDGRYGFVNTPEEASTEFAGQLAGALQVAASDVKVQVEFNPKRVTAYRQIGYAKHQLTKQQFRDNTVDAAEISASEAGNALYIIETNPRGEGPVATVRARFRVPQTSDYREHEWVVPFGSAVELEQSSSALRLATSASAFSEWLAGSPFAGEVTTDRLLGLISGVPEVYGADPRPKKLEWMIRQAKSISGK